MNFEVDRYSSAWAHIALCADLTWSTEPPDDFIIANQRLWAQHCRVSHVLQDTATESLTLQNNQCELTETRSSQSQENGSCSGKRSVKDVIPESRLAQSYGNFFYDDDREKSYTNPNEKPCGRSYNQACENSDLTECWMLPEVEYWFRKLIDDPDRSIFPRRRRQYRTLAEDDLLNVAYFHYWWKISCHSKIVINEHRSAASERWGPIVAAGEQVLAARIRSVKNLWSAPNVPQRRPPSPPSTSRKMRARRRQPRRLASMTPPTPYCLEAPVQLLCDPSCKIHFDAPRPPQLIDCQRAMGRLSASVQAVMRASAVRCPQYRGTNVSRYTPTQRPRCPDRRYGVWWPRDHPSPRLDNKLQLTHNQNQKATQKEQTKEAEESKKPTEDDKKDESNTAVDPPLDQIEGTEVPSSQQSLPVIDNQTPSTSAAAAALEGLKKRLYSTVLSTTAPILPPIGVRLSQKIATPGILKLNPKIVLPAQRIRPNVDNKFEELEKEALEQYKASDESIDTKFRELEKQAVEQYSTSNSNTSCSSGNSAEKNTSSSTSVPEVDPKNQKQNQPAKFPKEKAVDSVVIYSQNFPDLNAKGANSVTNLKNFHTPPRGEKKEQPHRPCKLRTLKMEKQRATSDDNEARECKTRKDAMCWTLHVMPKKRHLAMCASDFSSDDEDNHSIKHGSCVKSHVAGKLKLSALGAGDLHPIMRKT